MTGIVAGKTSDGLVKVIDDISQELAQKCHLRGVAPCWESPYHRFLIGDGGSVLTIWEALEMDNEMFPIWIDGQQYQPEDLAFRAAQTLVHRREIAETWVGKDRLDIVEKRCSEFGHDPQRIR